MHQKGKKGLPGGSVLEGEDGEDVLLPARLCTGTYNPKDGGEDEAEWVLFTSADMFSSGDK